MPKLPTFTADLGTAPASGGRRATAQDFGAGGGVEMGRKVGKLAQNYLEDAEAEESRKALIASSELRAKYARALDEAALTGADTEQLKEKMQEEFSKVGENFATKRGAEALQLHTSNTDMMFDEQSNRIKVQRAAATARLEGSKFLNSASEIIRSNPLYLSVAEKDAEAFVQTLQNISPEQRAEIAQGLKKELNMASAVASARTDPEATKKRLEAGDWDLTPAQREAAVSKADTEVRARRADEAYQRAVKEYDERERDDKARDKNFAAIMDGTATRRAIMDDADLRPQTREHLITFMEARAKERMGQEKKSDPTVVRDLWLRIHAPESDPKKIFNGDAIFEAVAKGQLNTTDANQLNVLVANQKDENNRSFGTRLQARMTTVAGVMRSSPEFAAQPELSAAIQLEMMAQVEQRTALLRKENKDPSVLLDPNAKEYYFTPDRLKQVADDVKARTRAMGGQPNPVRVDSQEAYDALEPGTPYIDSQGNAGIKKGAAKKTTPKFPVTPSGETPGARERRAEAEIAQKYKAWQDSAASERVDFVEWLMTGGKGL